ncbi:MAG: RNA polymerase factor sigma-54 [Rubrimonas sp.]
MRQRLEIRQSQQLVMTPQLRQSIQMLQMSNVELGAYLAEAVEANPLLTLVDGADAAAGPDAALSADAPVETPPMSADPGLAGVDDAIRAADPAAIATTFDTGGENLFEADGPAMSVARGGAASEGLDGEAPIAATVTLAQHVAAQLALMRLDPQVRLVAELLADELDDAGYLRIHPDDVAVRLGVAPAVARAAAAAVRACEPTGVGARDLADCLALQLAERDRLDPAMARLIENLAQVPTLPAARLAALCGVDDEDLRDMLAELRALDPRPGLRFGAHAADPVTPEILVLPDGAGGWRVVLNPETTPRLLIDRSYAARVSADRETRLFLSECAQSASWLRRSLDQRARTIIAVAAEIVRAQAGFFERGVAGLRPMTLRAVADAVGVHESTVSRVAANKHLSCPRGVFDLKFFFTAALGSSADGGESLSATAVRDRIRALVAAEPPGRPLSDDQIVAALAAEGVEVARRTVAKYREALRIPSSVERRRRARSAV